MNQSIFLDNLALFDIIRDCEDVESEKDLKLLEIKHLQTNDLSALRSTLMGYLQQAKKTKKYNNYIAYFKQINAVLRERQDESMLAKKTQRGSASNDVSSSIKRVTELEKQLVLKKEKEGKILQKKTFSLENVVPKKVPNFLNDLKKSCSSQSLILSKENSVKETATLYSQQVQNKSNELNQTDKNMFKVFNNGLFNVKGDYDLSNDYETSPINNNNKVYAKLKEVEIASTMFSSVPEDDLFSLD